jgi:hypothetical protein
LIVEGPGETSYLRLRLLLGSQSGGDIFYVSARNVSIPGTLGVADDVGPFAAVAHALARRYSNAARELLCLEGLLQVLV